MIFLWVLSVKILAPGTTPSQHIPNIHNMRGGFESWWYLHLDWHLLVMCLTLSTSATKNRAAFNPSLFQRITGNYTRMNKWTICYSSECLRKQQVCRHQMEENIIAIPASHRVAANRAVNAFGWFLSFFMCFPLKVGGFFLCPVSVRARFSCLGNTLYWQAIKQGKTKNTDGNINDHIKKITSWTQSLCYEVWPKAWVFCLSAFSLPYWTRLPFHNFTDHLSQKNVYLMITMSSYTSLFSSSNSKLKTCLVYNITSSSEFRARWW